MDRCDLPSRPDFVLHPEQARAYEAAARLFARISDELKRTLPASAEILHVGATAVPGCLTKGDLDIVVRVPAPAFAAADAVLAARFTRNVGSRRTDTFSSFEDAQATPHLGIQLTVAGGEDDYFHLFVEALRREPELVARYNALKRGFDGKPMDAYRVAKGAFIAEALGRRPGP
jgi:GrpB-like predicted nucleotidyltransferase (UPF0157 family)